MRRLTRRDAKVIVIFRMQLFRLNEISSFSIATMCDALCALSLQSLLLNPTDEFQITIKINGLITLV